MTTKLVLVKDINGNVTYGIPVSDSAYNTTLMSGTAQNFPVPATATLALITWTSGADIFVNPYGTAVAPTGAVATTTSYMNPIQRLIPVNGNGDLSILTTATSAYVEVSFYQGQA